MSDQAFKAKTFRLLHEQKQAFVMPNPWDLGTAKLLAHHGFRALATTSAGLAFACGRKDGTVTRDEMLQHVTALVTATDLPVSADLLDGFGEAPEVVAETIRLAALAGAVGGSIEDSKGGSGDSLYSMELSVARVIAAVEAARNLAYPFTSTARAENALHGREDLVMIIKRLQAYQQAGADVLFAPGLANKEDIVSVLSEVDRPLNVLVGPATAQLTVAELSDIGVRRISTGSSLFRSAFGTVSRAAADIQSAGILDFALNMPSYREINRFFAGEAGQSDEVNL